MASRLQDVIQRGTRAAQPLATSVAAGTLYYVTDEGLIERSDGTSWEAYSSSSGSSGAASSGYALSLLGDSNNNDSESIIIPGPQGIQGPSGQPIVIPGIDGEDAEPILIPGLQGIQGIAGANGVGDLLLATVPLSDAAIKTISSVPIQVVAAPAAGKIIIPIMGIYYFNITANYSNNPTLTLQWNGSSINLTSAATSSINAISEKFASHIFILFNVVASTFDPRAKSLVLKGTADPTGAGAATGTAMIIYSVVTP